MFQIASTLLRTAADFLIHTPSHGKHPALLGEYEFLVVPIQLKFGQNLLEMIAVLTVPVAASASTPILELPYQVDCVTNNRH